MVEELLKPKKIALDQKSSRVLLLNLLYRDITMSQRRGYTFLLFLILLLTASSSLSYYLWQQLQQLHEQTRDLPKIHEQLTEFHKKLQESPEQQLQAISERFKPLEEEFKLLSKQQQQTDGNVTILSHQVSQLVENPDWVIAEVNYLVTLAHHRLTIAKDPSGALLALIAADERLRRLNNPTLDKIRGQLGKDMLSLRNLPSIDIESVINRLTQYASHADNFPLIQGKLVVTSSAESPKSPSEENKNLSWQTAVASIGAALKELVTIRYNQNAETGKLSVDQRFYVVENLRLRLEMAKLAAYRRDNKTFPTAILSVLDWLNRYFDQHDNAITAMQKDLTEMQTFSLTQQLPDITESLNALQRASVILSETPNTH